MNKEIWRGNRKYKIAGLGIFLAYVLLHIVFQRHELLAYDVYTYISFADHYSENWFYTIIPEQAHGLEIVSYPPLFFQVSALLSFLPFINETLLSILVASAGATAFSFAFFYLFKTISGIETDHDLLIILFIAFSPGLLRFILVHGQLTLIFGTTFGLLSTTYFYKIINGEDYGVYLIITLIITAFIHHFSFLITALMFAIISLVQFRKVVSRIDYLVPVFSVSGLIVLLGMFPMVYEMLFGVIQDEIYHGSRYPLEHHLAFNSYITSLYGASILGIVFVFRDKINHIERPNSLTINLLTLIFLILGLGLTTPLPEVLFGDTATKLVYDRFSLLASLFLTSLVGVYAATYQGSLSRKIPLKTVLLTVFVVLSLGAAFWTNSLHHGSYVGYGHENLGSYNQTQAQTALDFLNEEASEDYLYMTHGHGLPIGEIERNTEIPTLDTGYFTGRKIEFASSYDKLDRTTRSELENIIHHASNVSLKYVLTFDDQSASWMNDTGWDEEELGNDVKVWTNPDPGSEYERDLGERRILFGIIPPIFLVISFAFVLSERLRSRAEKGIKTSQQFLNSFLNLSRDSLSGYSAYGIILLLPFLAAAPAFLTSGLPAGVDSPLPLFRAELMTSLIEEYGQIYYWTDLWYNGSPLLAVYSPLGTYLLYYTNVLFQDITLSYNTLRLLTLVLTASAVYTISREISEDKRVRLFSVVLVTFSYPLYSNLFTVGRFSSALAVPVYLFLITLLVRDDLFQQSISSTHVLLGLGSGILFLMHTMMAYLFLFTGTIFFLVYRDNLRELGLAPIAAILFIPLLLGAPYLTRFIQHMNVLGPAWNVAPLDFSLVSHIDRNFAVQPPPLHMGWIHAVLLAVGVMSYRRMKNKFLQFSLLNLLLFYILFWSRNYGLKIIPFMNQFDLARFEILFATFGVFIAVYGLDHLLENKLLGIDHSKITLFLIILSGLVILDTSPMLTQSANWSPEFEEELSELPLDDNYRGMGIGMRHWDAYLLWDAGVPNVFGWFPQANPNEEFTELLQKTGGRWYATDLSEREDDPELRKNLMHISNTRYIISPKGQWLPSHYETQTIGLESTIHPSDRQLRNETFLDEEFKRIHSSEHLDVYELEREMSYCERIEPVWIENNYADTAKDFFREGQPLPKFPVEGTPAEKPEGGDIEVRCDKKDPYTISLDVDGSGWVLVKESYYPFWERVDGGEIHNGFGFMVVYVEEGTELKYQPRDLSTFSIDDLITFIS